MILFLTNLGHLLHHFKTDDVSAVYYVYSTSTIPSRHHQQKTTLCHLFKLTHWCSISQMKDEDGYQKIYIGTEMFMPFVTREYLPHLCQLVGCRFMTHVNVKPYVITWDIKTLPSHLRELIPYKGCKIDISHTNNDSMLINIVYTHCMANIYKGSTGFGTENIS